MLKRLGQRLEGELQDEMNEMLDICISEVGRLDIIVNQFLGAVRARKPEKTPQRIDVLLRESPPPENKPAYQQPPAPESLDCYYGSLDFSKPKFFF